MRSILRAIIFAFLFYTIISSEAQIRVLEFSPCGNFQGKAQIRDRYNVLKAEEGIWHKFGPPCWGSAGAVWMEDERHLGEMNVAAAALREYSDKDRVISGFAGGSWAYWRNEDARYAGHAQGQSWVRFAVTEPVRVWLQLYANTDSDVGGLLCPVSGEAEAIFSDTKPLLSTRSVYQGESSPWINQELVLCPGEYQLSASGQAQYSSGPRCGASGDDWPRGIANGSFQLEVIETLAQC